MKNLTLSNTTQANNYLIVLSLSILFYLPYILHTFYNVDTIRLEIFFPNFNPLPDMYDMLKKEYKPLYGFFMFNYLPYKIGIPSQLLVLMGVVFFSIAIYGFVNFFVPTLSKLSKLIIYLLAFCNPYIFTESGWWGQFMGQGIVSCLYLASFILIDKYKTEHRSLKKNTLSYGIPIFSVVFGLNFFMPSFFHFVVLAFLYVLKNHLEKPFKSVKEFFIFSLPLFIIMGLGAIIYIVEIKSLLSLLNINLTDGRAKDYNILSSFSELKGRLIHVYNAYPQIYNILSLWCFIVLFFLKKNKLNILFILLTPIVILICYSFLIILRMGSSSGILAFPNYYLFVFLLAFILVYLKNYRLKTMLKITSLALILFFYFSSYFFAVWGLKHEKVLKTELAKLEQVAYSQFERGLPIVIVGDVKNWDKKLIKIPFIIKNLFSHGYGQYTRALSTWGFSGGKYGFQNITGKFYIKNNNKLKKDIEVLRSNGKIYPKEGSILLDNGTIYVVGDKK